MIPMGLYGHADYPPGAKAATNDGDEATAVKQMLDRLHYHKIDLADEIIVVSEDGYFGSSTLREIAYAQAQGKRVRYWQNQERSHGDQRLGWVMNAILMTPAVAILCGVSVAWKPGQFLAGCMLGIWLSMWFVVAWAWLTRRQSPNKELSEPGGPAASGRVNRVAPPGFAPVTGSGALQNPSKKRTENA